jgi:Rrf2 family protein
MFSQTVEYALRAMVYLADQGEARTTPQIATATKVPAPYLAKVLQQLHRAGLVRSQRGLHGGFALARRADELTIWDVVQGVEPIKRIRSCPLELESHRRRLCPLHKRLDDALAAVEAALRASTLAELLAEPTTSKPLCRFPQEIAVAAPAVRRKG